MQRVISYLLKNMSEYKKFLQDNPKIVLQDTPNKRNKDTTLFALEAGNIIQNNYSLENAKKYKKYITWNRKILQEALIDSLTRHPLGSSLERRI